MGVIKHKGEELMPNREAALINFSDFTSTSLKVVYLDQLLGAVLCRVLYIPISSSVLLVLCLISYHYTKLKKHIHTNNVMAFLKCLPRDIKNYYCIIANSSVLGFNIELG